MRTPLVLLALLTSAPALAEFKATIEASEKELGTEDLLDVTVTLINPPPGAQIEWNPGADFERDTSFNSNSSSNRKEQRTTSETRRFRPTNKGTLTFGGATVKTPLGTTVDVGTLSVLVIQGHHSSAKRAKPSEFVPQTPKKAPTGGDCFIVTYLGPPASTLGDPLDLSLRIFVKKSAAISEIDQISFELPENVLVDEQAIDRFRDGRASTIDGVEYVEFGLRSARVLPLAVGKFSVAAPSVRVTLGEKKQVLTATPIQLEVSEPSDSRRTFTADEGLALLRKKAGPHPRTGLLGDPNKPVSPTKNIKFNQ